MSLQDQNLASSSQENRKRKQSKSPGSRKKRKIQREDSNNIVNAYVYHKGNCSEIYKDENQ